MSEDWDWEEQCSIMKGVIEEQGEEIEFLRGEVARLSGGKALVLEARGLLRGRDTGQWAIDVEKWLAGLAAAVEGTG